MSENINKIVIARYELLSKTIASLETKIKTMPKGSVKVKRTRSGIYYCLNNGTASETYLTEDNCELIKLLIQKSYLREALKAAKLEVEALSRIIHVFPEVVIEDVYNSLSDERKAYANPIIPGDSEFAAKWLAAPYTKKLINIETEFYTLNGEHVRSKSEVIIADRLYSKGIPYKYECPLRIGNRVIHPDFTILRLSDRKVLYHEHCGMMDDPEYARDMVRRVNLYSNEDICLGDRLFMTFETSENPLDIKLLDEMIEKHFR